MRYFNRILKILQLLFFVALTWGIIYFISCTSPHNKGSLISLLPKETTFKASIHTERFIKTFLTDAFFKSTITSTEAKHFIPKKQNQKQKIITGGVDFRSEVVYFQDVWRKQSSDGILFRITNYDSFKTFQQQFKEYTIQFNENYGVVYLTSDKTSKKTKEHLIQKAQSIISNKPKISNKDESSIINVYYKGNKNTYMKNISLGATVQNERILLTGKGTKNQIKSHQSNNYYSITNTKEKEYLEIQSGQLPDSIYNYIDVIFNEIGIELPTMNYQQLLVYGFNIDNSKGKTVFLPNFDGVFRFNKTLDIQSKIDSICLVDQKIKKNSDDSYLVREYIYYFKQLSSNEVYFGTSPNIDMQKLEGNPLTFIRGNPSALLNIEADGFVAQIIMMLPQVKYTKQFFENVDCLDIHTENISEKKINIIGEMRLKKGKMMSVEMVKYLLLFF